MKKIILAILVLMAVAMTSCTTADAMVYEEPSVEYIITYGTPHYYNGVVIYYYYNGYMYYPRHHRVYYSHRHHVRPPQGSGPNRPHRPHGYEPNGHKHGDNHGTRPGSRPSTIHNGNGGHGNHGGHGGHVGRQGSGGSHGHGGSGGRPSAHRRR